MGGKKMHIRVPRIILWLELLAIGTIYYATMLPTVGFWDTGEFQTIPYSWDIGHPPGYPTYIIIGRIFSYLIPFGNFAWRMNFMSLVAMLVALYFAYKSIAVLAKNHWVGLIIIPILGISSQLFWQLSLVADPHALHMALVSLLTYLLLKAYTFSKLKYLSGAAFLLGISLGNHLLSIFFIPGLLLVICRLFLNYKHKIKIIISIILKFMLGVSVYGLLLWIGATKEPLTTEYRVNTLPQFFHHVLGKDFQSQMHSWNKGSMGASFTYYGDIMSDNLPIVLICVAILGLLVAIIHFRWEFALVLLPTLGTVLFSLRYQNGFLERYFLFSLWTIAVLGGTGLGWIFSHLTKRWTILGVICTIAILISLPYQSINNYKNNDQSHNISAYEYAINVLSNVSENGYLITWWSYATPLWYLQKVEGYRQDVHVVNKGKQDWEQTVNELIAQNKETYVAEQFSFNPKSAWTIQQQGKIYRILPATAPSF